MILIGGKVSAQIRATTASGNKVLLFPNGTWKYDEGQLTMDSLPHNSPKQQAVMAPSQSSWSMKIDSNRVDSTAN